MERSAQERTQNEDQPTPQRPTMNRSSVYLMLFLLALLFLNFTDNSSRGERPTAEKALELLRQEKEAISDAQFNVNVTHPLPTSVRDQVQELLADPSNMHHYHNMTGIIRGDWTSRNVTESLPMVVSLDDDEEDEPKDPRGDFPFDLGGSYTFNIKSSKAVNDDIHLVEGHVRLRDKAQDDHGVLLLAEGVHFLRNGSFYLVGAPDGLSVSYLDLLHMLPDDTSMTDTKEIMIKQMDERIAELEKRVEWGWPMDEDNENAPMVVYNCSFQLFAQLEPLPGVLLSDLLEFEQELENPKGIRIIHPPPPVMSTVMYSPNCDLVLSANHSKGIKIELYYRKAITFACVTSILAIVQILALVHQMEFTPTPSSVSNVSYWTIAMQAIMDGYICLAHSTIGIVVDSVFLPFITAAFFSLVLAWVFGMRYLLLVWRIQRPEAQRAAANTTQRPSPTTAASSSTPVSPVSSSTSSTPSNQDPDGDPRRDATMLFYAILLLGLLLVYQSTIRVSVLRSMVTAVLITGLFSFWIPQIIRNVTRGCRKPLSSRYILVMSATRLVIPLYIFGCPNNLDAYQTTPWVWALVAYVALQAVILFLQDALGPRFFVPKKFLPETYNYHPILTPNDEENTSNMAGSSSTDIHRSRDCSICMLPIDVQAGSLGLHVLNQTQYMVTPCHHVFHTECLETWMRIKLECPVCRSFLPPC